MSRFRISFSFSAEALFVFAMVQISVPVAGQLFVPQFDTLLTTVNSISAVHNDISNITERPVQITWKVAGHDFPADWSGPDNLGVCDNLLCRMNFNNQLLSGQEFTSAYYAPGQTGPFHLQLNLSDASPGTHSLAVSLKDSTGFEKIVVFIISRGSATGLKSSGPYNACYVLRRTTENSLVLEFGRAVSLIQIIDMNGKVQYNASPHTKVVKVPSGLLNDYYVISALDMGGNVICRKKVCQRP